MSVFICTVICNHCNPAKIRLCFKTEYKISDDGAKIIIIKWNKKKKGKKTTGSTADTLYRGNTDTSHICKTYFLY